jgi:DNA polymerase-1
VAEDTFRDLVGDPDLSLGSPPAILAALSRIGVVLPSTDKATLRAAPAHPAIDALRAFRKAAKQAGSFGVAMVERFYHATSGRLYASIRQIGARTGRMAYRDPNLQQLPKKSRQRAAVHAPPGRLLWDFDLTQIELVVAADLSEDAGMLDAIRAGRDLHTTTAAALFACILAEVSTAQRDFGKLYNLSRMYRAGRERRATMAREAGLPDDPASVDAMEARFVAAFPQLEAWCVAQLRSEAVDVRTRSGRRRRLVPEPRTRYGKTRLEINAVQRVNTPISGTAADLFKEAVARMQETHERAPGAQIVLLVHDEVLVEAGEDQGEAVTAWVEGAFRDASRRYLRHVEASIHGTGAATWGGA